MEYKVKIDAFEGPLDLLLHLIHQLEIDIYDIPMAEITEQYLDYIHTMKQLELDVASEYLVMAATLLAIKSKMLLPNQEQEEPEDEFVPEEDPREALVERLLEYKKYKEAARKLKRLESSRSEMFTKPPSDLSEFAADAGGKKIGANVTIYDMIGALNKLLRRKKLQKPLSTKITRQEISIEERMDDILKRLEETPGSVHFNELFPFPDKEHIVVTFLAVLELIKRHEIIVEQEENFGEILVARKGEK
ncbi:segregation and condensation protein A [Weizmannia acidilactici]|uniref:Segregation and condensation protein A n=1 Tax=Weizmannia acidilactici TaxID=2607726 RepID=A0A5J4J2U4_9BACI|nr:segregation/condensation protein A [Weizmannia acidilactici]GER66069.1 segregation and condensation protein A [Weizmannia acidilactici]GER69296.1 segregation and condensation protein A [Weizmannia acidilactici]GER72378.1 segregation and condensation protein A [Weizmannia acidilactici]